MSILTKLYFGSSITRKVIRVLCNKRGGEYKNQTLRKIYREGRNISAGYFSYGWTQPGFDGPAVIGNYSSIASPVRRISVNHNMGGVSTHPFYFNPALNICEKDPRERTTLHIGHDVWIGSNVTILPSVSSIGNGSIIGAGTVLTSDVPPYAIVVGNPGKVIKYRFSESVIQDIQKTEWWNMPEKEIKDNYQLFFDVQKFINKYK